MKPKLCECGCGQPAPIAKSSWKKRGFRKGQPMRFISGHNAKIQFNHPLRLRIQHLWWKFTTAIRARIQDRKTHSEKCREGWTPEARARLGATMRKLAKTRKYKTAKSNGMKAARERGAYHGMDKAKLVVLGRKVGLSNRGKGRNQKALDARVAEIIRTGDPNAKPAETV